MANPNPNPAGRWKPGQSGNPSGRPKGRTVGDRLNELLGATESTIDGIEIPEGKDLADMLAEVIVRQALAGDPKFLGMLLDRTEGPVSKLSKIELAATVATESEELSPGLEAALESLGYVRKPGLSPDTFDLTTLGLTA